MKIRCELIQNQGLRGNLVLALINARHCYLEVECPGRFHYTLEIYGPSPEWPQFPDGKAMMQPNNPDRNRHSSSRNQPDCPQNCDYEEALIRSYEREAEQLPPYNYRGPNSNTFITRVVKGAGGDPRFPVGAYGK